MSAPVPINPVEHLALCQPPLGIIEGKVQAFLSAVVAVLDDAGTHKGSSLVMCAGWVGGINQWVAFERRWKRVLVEAGPPFDFHALEFFKRKPSGELKGRYSDWSPEKARRVLARLLRIVNGVKIHPVVYAVKGEDFRSFSRKERWWLGGGATHEPYYLPLRAAVYEVARYTKPKLKVQVFHDNDEKRAGRAKALFDRIKSGSEFKHADRLGIFSAESRTELVPLQAADLLAYVARRIAQDRSTRSVEEKACQAIFGKKGRSEPAAIKTIDQRAMQKMVDQWRDQGADL